MSGDGDAPEGASDDEERQGEVLPFRPSARHPSLSKPDTGRDEPEDEKGEQLPLGQPNEASNEASETGEHLENEEPPPFGELTREHYVLASTHEYRSLAEDVAKAESEQHELQPVAASMMGVDSGLVGFDDVTGEVALEEEAPRSASDLAVRAVTGLMLFAVFLATLLAGGRWLTAFILLVALFALGELYATARKSDLQPIALIGLAGLTGVVVGTSVAGTSAIAGFLTATSVVVLIFYAVTVRRNPLENASVTILGVGWVGLLAFALPMAASRNPLVLMLAIVLMTALFDTGSYVAGKRFGSRRLAPILSPHKTVEGLAGGVLVALALGAAASFIEPFTLTGGLALAMVVSVFAPLGDLAESMLKRGLGVKDMGSLLPGHGGMIDRIDALLFVVPAAYYLFSWLDYL